MMVLVTGSTGFIGSHLCRALLEQGETVRAFHRPTSTLRLLEGLDVEHVSGDLTQPDSLLAAMDGVEAVFHVAAWMGGHDQPGRQYAVTVEGTRAVLQAARKSAVRRVVYTSSVAALGVPQAAYPIDEHHTWNFRPDHYPYGYAKYMAELEVQKAVAQGLDAVIVNPSLVFGPGDVYRASSSIIAQVPRRRITLAIEGGINAVHVQDVARGHLAAFERGRCGQRYILGNENLTYFQLVNLIAGVCGSPPPNLVLPAWLVRRAARPAQWMQAFLNLPVSAELLRLAGHYFFYKLEKARQELGWEPQIPVRQAIEEANQWFQ